MTLSADLLLSIYTSVLPEKAALYCSAPITSGHRFIDWVSNRAEKLTDVDHAMSSYPDEHKKWVVEPNVSHARSTISGIRRAYDVPVIDPTSVPHIAVWKQSDWLNFWERVIERFSVALVLLDDWQFSFGCSHEFVFSQQRGIPAYDERGNRMTWARGASLIANAAETIERVGGSAVRLRRLIDLRHVVPAGVEVHAPDSLSALLSEFKGCTSKTRS